MCELCFHYDDSDYEREYEVDEDEKMCPVCQDDQCWCDLERQNREVPMPSLEMKIDTPQDAVKVLNIYTDVLGLKSVALQEQPFFDGRRFNIETARALIWDAFNDLRFWHEVAEKHGTTSTALDLKIKEQHEQIERLISEKKALEERALKAESAERALRVAFDTSRMQQMILEETVKDQAAFNSVETLQRTVKTADNLNNDHEHDGA